MKNYLTTIMFADIVGYSAMMEADQARAVGTVRELNSHALEPAVSEFSGTVLKRLGDGWIISFDAIGPCVECALKIQTSLQSFPGAKLRVGCHVGDIVQDDHDIYGSGINIAERIQAEAPPGGVMVSEDVWRQLSAAQAELLKEAGVFRLKNIAKPMRLYQWRPSAPGAESVDEATSIAIPATEYAPHDAETAAIAGDLRDQLFVRMSRRSGIVVFDAAQQQVRNATYDLRSRLRVAGSRGRLGLTLVLRADGRPVWSESYDASTDDVFEFSDSILERAEADLRLHTNAFDGDRLAHLPEQSLSVSELRARAANLYYQMTYESWNHGRDLMQRALDLNPDDGIAFAMKVEAEIMLASGRYESVSEELMPEFEDGLDRAVEQNPSSDYVFWTRGIYRLHCRQDINGARADLENAQRVNPAYIESRELDGHIRMAEGDFKGAAEQFDMLLKRQTHDPMIPYRLFLKACALYCDGQFQSALTEARRASDLRPRDRILHTLTSLAAAQAGEAATAAQYRARADALERRPSACSRMPIVPASRKALTDALRNEVA